MLFKELIRSVIFDDVWEVLDREYKLKPGTYEVYQRVVEELTELSPSASDDELTLVVAKIEDVFEPGTFTFEIFGVKKGDENHYGLEMTSWDEWLGYTVLKKSIEIYGPAAVVAHALYEMTFFGNSAQTVTKRIEEEKQILKERLQELESGNMEVVSGEELRGSLGIPDKRSDEERKQRKRQVERIQAENKKVYKELLSSWRQS